MAKIVAIANHKGGVGKTTSTLSIGSEMANLGFKVLLVDLDPQSNLTLSINKEPVKRTVYDAIIEGKNLPIVPIKRNLYLSPSNTDLATANFMPTVVNSEGFSIRAEYPDAEYYVIKSLIEPIKDNYDYILMDCPPFLGTITLNALTAATNIIIPFSAEALSLIGLSGLIEFCAMVQLNYNSELKFSGVFVTRYQKRRLSQMVIDMVKQEYKGMLYYTMIRENTDVATAPAYRMSVIDYAPQCKGAADYRQLTQEVIKRLKD